MSVVDSFHPVVRAWFTRRFDAPTDAQTNGWPHIIGGRDTLISAPTGSGKTLAAFLVSIDRLVRKAEAGDLEDGVEVVYVSPLKALSNDTQPLDWDRPPSLRPQGLATAHFPEKTLWGCL